MAIGGFARVFEGGFEKSRVFAWCIAGEFVVNCVVIVDVRHHVAWSLKTCHEFEIYFHAGCGKARGQGRFGNDARKYRTFLDSVLAFGGVVAIVGDRFDEERM